MRLNWIKLYEKLDKDKLQEVYYEPNQQIYQQGEILVYCRTGRHWVTEYDFKTFCQQGFHEYAREITIDIDQTEE